MAKLKEQPSAEVVETLRDPLVIASDARLIAERLQAQAMGLRQITRSSLAPTAIQKVRSGGPGMLQHWVNQLRHELAQDENRLREFQQTLNEARTLLETSKAARTPAPVPERPTLLELDQARVRADRFKTANVALMELELVIRDVVPIYESVSRDFAGSRQAQQHIIDGFEDELDLQHIGYHTAEASKAQSRLDARKASRGK